MSEDLKTKLHALARGPSGPLDIQAVKRSAHRAHLRDRGIAASAALAIAAGGYVGWEAVTHDDRPSSPAGAPKERCDGLGAPVSVFLATDVSDERREALTELIEAIPGSESVTVVSPQAAMDEFLEANPGANPPFGKPEDLLPWSIRIDLEDDVYAHEFVLLLPQTDAIDEVRTGACRSPER